MPVIPSNFVVGGVAQLAALDPGPGLEGRVRAWVWSRRSWFYYDYYLGRTVPAPVADGVRFIAGSPGGYWVREYTPDVYAESITEFWYDNAAGDNDADGAYGSPIKNIDELSFRIRGGTTDVVLYTPAALGDSEAELYRKLESETERSLTLVNGELPGAPIFDFRPENLSASNWSNAGRWVGSATKITGTTQVNTIASAGKLRNASSVQFNGSTYFRTGDVPGLIAPITWVVVMRANDTSARVIVDGNDGSNRAALLTSGGSWILYAGGGSGVDGTLPLPTVNLYHLAVVNFRANAATFAANGSIDPLPRDAGAQMPDGVTIGAGGDGAAFHNGEIVRLLGYDGTLQMHSPSIWDDWARYWYAFNGAAQ